MVRRYKVLEVMWFRGGDFQQEYCGSFESLDSARDYVHSHESEWESDLEETDAIGIGIEIETWEKDFPESDDSFEELVDTYTEWCKDAV